ncbi:MAG: aromatic ring-hydroxylating dioxygenase subunit alpha [Dehalococcoidia bacterium]|nr:aromatic ring-hydroxylating dioxygenase subunit alpha [Dehalococcoidia bacterium]
MTTTYSSMVDSKRGYLNRRIFVDRDIYQQELEQVFGRSWLYVGHESQTPKNNDFAASYMGEDPILLTRDSKGKVHAFLNMCRHRGNRICRADAGNAPSFMCTYHGWTFATDGKLVGVPGYKEAYFEELERSQWGLVEAPNIESFRGLVFANWDKQAPTLSDYLGDMAWYMDMIFSRRSGGTEVIGGVHRWVINANWKFAADNFAGDQYHTYLTHGSLRAVRNAKPQRYGEGGWTAHPGNGHGIVRFEDLASSSERNRTDQSNADITVKYRAFTFTEAEKRVGSLRAENASTSGVFTVFPNLSYHASPFVRVWLPRGPEKTEIWSYCIVDKDAPADVKEALRKKHTFVMGPGGAMDADDMNNWIQCTGAGRTLMGKRYPINQQLGVGHEGSHEQFPGIVQAHPSELNQRSFYGWWAQLMDAGSWNDIKLTPKTVA